MPKKLNDNKTTIGKMEKYLNQLNELFYQKDKK